MQIPSRHLRHFIFICVVPVWAYTGLDVNTRAVALPDRHYTVGETLRYEMQGNNNGWTYTVFATGTVKKDSNDEYFEEIGWSDFRSSAVALSPASLAFRQTLSLNSTGKYLSIPDLSKVQPFLIGPITDLLTFYSDIFVARQLKLTHIGQRATFHHAKPNSWADGQRIILGEDSIDFEATFLEVDDRAHTATVQVRHVPPEHPQIKLPAKWMEAQVGGAANNWVQVERSGNQFKAGVGQEFFDVHLTLDTRDGKLLRAQLHNSVATMRRECTDSALTQCTEAKPQAIVRDINLRLLP